MDITMDGKRRPIYLDQVLFVPGLKNNLFSVQKATEMGHDVQFGRGSCCIKSVAGDIPLKRKGGLYILETASSGIDACEEYWLPVPVRQKKAKEEKPAKSSSDESVHVFEDAKTDQTPVKKEQQELTWSQVARKGNQENLEREQQQEWKIVTPKDKKRNQSDKSANKGKRNKEQMKSPSKKLPPRRRSGREVKEPDRLGFRFGFF
jgi:hypothetical protein